jgi:hypothetical protein
MLRVGSLHTAMPVSREGAVLVRVDSHSLTLAPLARCLARVRRDLPIVTDVGFLLPRVAEFGDDA